MRGKGLKVASGVIGAIGIALLVLMITTEGELGALPLGLILLGVVGFVAGHILEKSVESHER